MKNKLFAKFSCESRAWIIWAIAALFYAYEFFVRISPSVMVNNLQFSLHLDALQISNLSAVYYYAYAVMQIPVGMLLDRFGVRILLTAAAAMVAVGSLLFASADTLSAVIFGRVLMGVGSAFSFVGCLKLATNWFNARRFAIVVGLTNMVGVIGALFGEAPLSMVVSHEGWRTAMMAIGIFGAALALIICLMIRDNPKETGCPSALKTGELKEHHFIDGLLSVVKCKQAWLAAFIGCLMVAPISAFTELWSVPFLMKAHHFLKSDAAALSSMVFVGIGVGAPIHGWISGVFKRRKPQILIGAIAALLFFLLIVYTQIGSFMLLMLLLFLFGFFTSTMILIFAINTESNPHWAGGVVIGFTNMLVMLGGTIFQPIVGYLLDTSTHIKGTVQYSLSDYHHALIVLPMCLIAAIILACFLKETRCKSVEELPSHERD